MNPETQGAGLSLRYNSHGSGTALNYTHTRGTVAARPSFDGVWVQCVNFTSQRPHKPLALVSVIFRSTNRRGPFPLEAWGHGRSAFEFRVAHWLKGTTPPPVPLSQSLSFSRATHAVVVGDMSVAETKRQWIPDGSGVSGAGSGGVYVCVCVCALRLKIRGLLKWPCKYGNVTIDRLVQFGSWEVISDALQFSWLNSIRFFGRKEEIKEGIFGFDDCTIFFSSSPQSLPNPHILFCLLSRIYFFLILFGGSNLDAQGRWGILLF